MHLPNGTHPASFGATITLSRIPTPDGTRPQIQVVGPGCPMWFPDNDLGNKCAEAVVYNQMHGMNNIGQPLTIKRKAPSDSPRVQSAPQTSNYTNQHANAPSGPTEAQEGIQP